jgi:hypothetical protein
MNQTKKGTDMEMTEADIAEAAGNVRWLIGAMQERGLDEWQCCAIMGCLLEHMLCTREMRNTFIAALTAAWAIRDSGGDGSGRRH